MIPSKWAPVRKIVATVLGGLTATAVVALGTLFRVTIDPTLAGAIVLAAGTLAGYLTPANEVPAPPPDNHTPAQPNEG